MMLMKTPTSGSSTGTAGGRDVIFRLSVQPSADAPAKLRTWGESMRKEQALFSVDGRRVAKEWEDSWTKAISNVTDKMRAASRDWSGAMRGVGIGGGPGGGPAGIGGGGGSSGLNMAALAASRAPAWTPSPWPSMGGSSPWAPPAGMAGLGAGAPIYNNPHVWPSMAGGSSSGAGGGGAPRLGIGGNRYGSSLSMITSGAGQLVRGAAYSGLAGEGDSQKVLETLLRMEGMLGLIHGALALGRGLNGMGALGMVGGGMGAAAIAAGLIGVATIGGAAYEARNEGKTRKLSAGGERPGFFARLQQNPFSDFTSGNYWTGNGQDTSEAIYAADQSFKRMTKQQQAAQKAKETREGRMAGDATEFGKNADEFSFDAAYRRKGQRGDVAEYGNLGIDKAAKEAELARVNGILGNKDQRTQDETNALVRQRKQLEMEISDIVMRREDIQLKGEERRNQTALSRAQNNLGIAQNRLTRQESLTEGAVGRYRSDLSRFGGMSALDRARAAAAFRAVQSGNATLEQEQIASQFNEYAPKVDAARTQRGGRFGGAFFGSDASRSVTALREAEGVVKEAAAQVELLTKQKLDINIKIEGGGKELQDAADQIFEALKANKAQNDKEFAEKLDHIQRQLDKQQIARQIIAR